PHATRSCSVVSIMLLLTVCSMLPLPPMFPVSSPALLIHHFILLLFVEFSVPIFLSISDNRHMILLLRKYFSFICLDELVPIGTKIECTNSPLVYKHNYELNNKD